MTLRLERPVQGAARLRQKNQLTIPDAIARVLGVEPGDEIVFEADPKHPGLVHARRLHRSYAGALRGAYGTAAEVQSYLEQERDAWQG